MVKKEGIFVNSVVLLYALRYALKRIGPAHRMVRDDIFSNMNRLSIADLEQFMGEINKELKNKSMPEDEVGYWVNLIKDLGHELDLKKEIEEMYK